MSTLPLSWLNFFLSDVRDGLGPFLGIFLKQHGWAVDDIGYVTTLGALMGVLFTVPLGILVDTIRAKRLLIIFSALMIVIAFGFNYFYPNYQTTIIAQALGAIAGATIPPAINGITLGIVGNARFDYQLGQNESYNHAGNCFSALMAGIFSYYFGLIAIFTLMGLWTVLSIITILLINPANINYEQSRGLNKKGDKPKPLFNLFKNKGLIILLLTVTFFHLANAAMLPLLSQAMLDRNAITHPGVYTALTIIVAQAVMIPVALMAAKVANRTGYNVIFLIALVVLPIRGLLAGLITHPYILFPVQILDGIGAGLMGIAVPGLALRILNGSGRFNTGLSIILMSQGIAAACSSSIAGAAAKYLGYGNAYLVLSILALIGLCIWGLSIPFMSKFNKTTLHPNQ